ncbi:uncharacterized protein L199_005323 [Kwoniella botswanensis]|uniref:uncharacterized protein n=1 Tax=Kwoniella botswanensis TaxID=1268659 RepID=UPI00315C9EAF
METSWTEGESIYERTTLSFQLSDISTADYGGITFNVDSAHPAVANSTEVSENLSRYLTGCRLRGVKTYRLTSYYCVMHGHFKKIENNDESEETQTVYGFNSITMYPDLLDHLESHKEESGQNTFIGTVTGVRAKPSPLEDSILTPERSKQENILVIDFAMAK